MKKTVFIKNALILTATSLILRLAGIIFKVYITRLIGSEGVGLYQLIFSFYMLVSTFATSGISTAVTRLVSEEMGLGAKNGVLKIFRRSAVLTLLLALISVGIVLFGAEFIAAYVLGDPRAAPALKMLSLSLPFMGISSCIRGYFIARRNVAPNALTQIFEQAIRISLVLILVKKYISKGLTAACCALLAGDAVAEAASCFILYLCYLGSKKRLALLAGRKNPPYKITKKLLSIALPITSGRYLNTALRTGENVLVPKNLAKYPYSGENALSQFGMIKGMALPVLFFPSTLLNSVSTLLIPEISEAVAKKRLYTVKSATKRVLSLTSLTSFVFAGIFFFAGEPLGQLIYASPQVGLLLKYLSPIVPFMYLDSISDGILKGLDEQVFTFRTAVSDSVLRIILILIALPLSGLKGFIAIMYFSNFLTCFLNVKRLCRVSGADFKFFKEIFSPTLLSTGVCFTVNSLLKFFNLPNFAFVTIFTAISVFVYLYLLSFFKIADFREILRNFKG